jgi:hypothetical protein
MNRLTHIIGPREHMCLRDFSHRFNCAGQFDLRATGEVGCCPRGVR